MSSAHRPATAGVKELRQAVADYYNREYRQGKGSQYTYRNVCIVPGGRAGIAVRALVFEAALICAARLLCASRLASHAWRWLCPCRSA